MPDSKAVRRFDRGELKSPVKTREGWLRVDGYLTRTGIFTYRNADGSERKELRLPAEVFQPDSLNSFSMVPLTDEHPAPGYLDADNTDTYMVGMVGETVRSDGEFVRASILVTKPEVVAKLETKAAVQLSCGYTCDLDFSPGLHEGQRYDAIQRNIRGNHVALVKIGRAGPQVAVRVDSADAVMVAFTPDSKDTLLPTKDASMIKLDIDGLSIEVPELAAQAFQKVEKKYQGEISAAKADATAAKADSDKSKARADAADAEVAKLKADLAASPEKIRGEIAARMSLEGKAKDVLGAGMKIDGLKDVEIKRAVIAKVLPSQKIDGKSEAYVEASFELAMEEFAKTDAALSALRSAPGVSPGAPLNLDAAREAFYKASREAYKTVSK